MIPSSDLLKLKWWQLLIIAVTVIAIDIVVRIPALDFGTDAVGSVNAVCISIATAALAAMGITPAIATNRTLSQEIKHTVGRIEIATDGLMTQRFDTLEKAGAANAVTNAERFDAIDTVAENVHSALTLAAAGSSSGVDDAAAPDDSLTPGG